MTKLKLRNGDLTISKSAENTNDTCHVKTYFIQEGTNISSIFHPVYGAYFHFNDENMSSKNAGVSIISTHLPLTDTCTKAADIINHLLENPDQNPFHLIFYPEGLSKELENPQLIYECFIKFNNPTDLPNYDEDRHSMLATFDILTLDEANKIHEEYWNSLKNPYNLNYQKLEYIDNNTNGMLPSAHYKLLCNPETEVCNIEITPSTITII